MAESFQVEVKRWPKPPSEGGQGGVFASFDQLAEALDDLHETYGFFGEIRIGSNLAREVEKSAVVTHPERPGQPAVSVKFGVLLAYFGNTLNALTVDEFVALTGVQP